MSIYHQKLLRKNNNVKKRRKKKGKKEKKEERKKREWRNFGQRGQEIYYYTNQGMQTRSPLMD